MLEYIKGKDILDGDQQILVNPVNCVGVMGAGLAKQFKFRFPSHFVEYKILCNSGELKPGKVKLVQAAQNDYRDIALFPTKDVWWESSRYNWIWSGLNHLHQQMDAEDIATVAFPRLGCGLGGLNWPTVNAMIKEEFANSTGILASIYV